MQNNRILLALCLSVLFLSGCGKNQSSVPVQNTELDLPYIKVGSDSYPPFIYVDENGDFSGIDVEIAKEAFRRLGYSVEFEIIPWEEKKELVDSGYVDCIWGAFSMLGEREKEYNWAGPYMIDRHVVATNYSSDIHTLKDLNGRFVAVQSTTRPEELFLSRSKANIPDVKEVYSFEDRNILCTMLGKGYIDAFAAHEFFIRQYMADNNMDFEILDEPLQISPLGVAFSKEDSRGLDKKLTLVFGQLNKEKFVDSVVFKYIPDYSFGGNGKY